MYYSRAKKPRELCSRDVGTAGSIFLQQGDERQTNAALERKTFAVNLQISSLSRNQEMKSF